MTDLSKIEIDTVEGQPVAAKALDSAGRLVLITRAKLGEKAVRFGQPPATPTGEISVCAYVETGEMVEERAQGLLDVKPDLDTYRKFDNAADADAYVRELAASYDGEWIVSPDGDVRPNA